VNFWRGLLLFMGVYLVAYAAGNEGTDKGQMTASICGGVLLGMYASRREGDE
jgi:hypothetical protein